MQFVRRILSANTLRTLRHRSLYLRSESLEARVLLSAAPIDGFGNNQDHPEWGSTGTPLTRLTENDYSDGQSGPSGASRPSARIVSNGVAAQTGSTPNDRLLTDYAWIWGQFVDHDIDLTGGATPAEQFPISVPAGDHWFDPFEAGTQAIGLSRSMYDVDSDGVRQQLNEITAFIDGSVVYGSDAIRAAELRTFSGGRLKTSTGDLLPFNTAGLPNAGGPSPSLFLAGDVRANENAALISMQTLWVREHNRIATDIEQEAPWLSDEEIYQEARSIVAAEIQAITYNEFLPALVGAHTVTPWDGYDSWVDPSIANEFSTAAYRFGHSLLTSELQRVDANGDEVAAGHLPLRDAFFNPNPVITEGIDSLLQGAATQTAQEIDTRVIDDVRNFLFGPPGAGGFDLASLNIQRGRDHGLADYNQTRIELGLEAVYSFDEITSDPILQAELESLYGSVDDIDLWVGGLAEDHLPGSSVGEVFSLIIVDQFERLRDGDRFYYENQFSGGLLDEIHNTKLSDVIERNTTVVGLQDNVFFDRSVFVVDLSQDNLENIEVRQNGDYVEVVDEADGSLLRKRRLSEINQVVVIASDEIDEQVTVKADISAGQLPGGIVVYSGESSWDQLVVVATASDDDVFVDNNQVQVNGLSVKIAGVEKLTVEALAGDDHVAVIDPGDVYVEVYGGDGSDTLTGSDYADELHGESGDDRLTGLGGGDFLDGGDGFDTLSGGRGNDTIYGGHDDDNVYAGSGRDVVSGESGNDRLFGENGYDTISGGNGDDWIRGGRGQDRLSGDEGHDELFGGQHSDTLSGCEGNDTLDAGSGADRVFAGQGNDLVDGGSGDDHLFGDSGNDTISGANGRDRIRGGSHDDQLDGGNEADTLHGDSGDDTLDGGNGDDVVFGGRGRDLISGRHGDDRLFGDNGYDTISGGAGNDLIRGGRGRDCLTGDDGCDAIFGDEHADHLDGGADEDTLTGGDGSDWADGGSDADIIDVRESPWPDGIDSVVGSDLSDTIFLDPGDLLI